MSRWAYVFEMLKIEKINTDNHSVLPVLGKIVTSDVTRYQDSIFDDIYEFQCDKSEGDYENPYLKKDIDKYTPCGSEGSVTYEIRHDEQDNTGFGSNLFTVTFNSAIRDAEYLHVIFDYFRWIVKENTKENKQGISDGITGVVAVIGIVDEKQAGYLIAINDSKITITEQESLIGIM